MPDKKDAFTHNINIKLDDIARKVRFANMDVRDIEGANIEDKAVIARVRQSLDEAQEQVTSIKRWVNG